MTCDICCEEFNKKIKKSIIVCNSCELSACRVCIEKYVITVDEPECMKCSMLWTHDTVALNLTKKFRTTVLKHHRETVLLNREKSLLPATLVEISRQNNIKSLRQEIRNIEKLLSDAKQRLSYAINVPTAIEQQQVINQASRNKPCPSQNCRGFLSEEENSCGLCGLQACPTCNELMSSNHVCDPEIVLSVDAIRGDSKPCPRCGSMIFRSIGCNQMFCTAPGCNIAFCWKTLKILDRTRIHNPHYFEFMRQRNGRLGRDLNDIPCGGMPTTKVLISSIERSESMSVFVGGRPVNKSDIYGLYPQCMKMHWLAERTSIVLLSYPALADVVDPRDNEDVRMRYIKGEIDETRFKVILQHREKRRIVKNEINAILSTFVNVAADLFRGIVIALGEHEEIRDVEVQLSALREYTFENLVAVSKRMSCKVPDVGFHPTPGPAGLPPPGPPPAAS